MNAPTHFDRLEQRRRLIADADQREALRRVAYRGGMLLGVEAMTDEQDYHRRRLTRHHAWLHGVGTVLGLAVSAEAEAEAGPDEETDVLLKVASGVALDGLGREVVVDEPYCISLTDWLQGRSVEQLTDAFDAGQEALFLRVTARYTPCPKALQPVLAGDLNASTDAVATGRIEDGFVLELLEDTSLGPDALVDPDARLLETAEGTPEDAWKDALTARERTFVDGLEAAEAAFADALRLRASLLAESLPAAPDAFDEAIESVLHERARVLLARVVVSSASLPVTGLTAERVQVNNMLRPFAHAAGQLVALMRQGG